MKLLRRKIIKVSPTITGSWYCGMAKLSCGHSEFISRHLSCGRSEFISRYAGKFPKTAGCYECTRKAYPKLKERK